MKRIAILFLSTALGFAVACGDNDEGSSGGAGDAGQPDAPEEVTGTCSLVIGDRYGGSTAEPLPTLAGVPVFFHSPTGELVGFALTDVKGTAKSDSCVEDTIITFVLDDDYGDDKFVVTYTNVQPDDTVYYRVPKPKTPDPLPTWANVSVTGDADVSEFPDINDNTGLWLANLGCSSGDGSWRYAADSEPPDDYTGPDGPIKIIDVDRCNLGKTPTDIDVLAFLYGSPKGGGIIGYAFAKDQPFTEGTDEDNMADNAVTLPAWTRGGLDNAGLVTNLPSNTNSADASWSQMVDGVEWYSGSFSDSWDVQSGAVVPPVAAKTFQGLPDGFGELSRASLSWDLTRFDSVNLWLHHQGLDQRSDFSRTVTLDALDRLPVVTSIAVEDEATPQPKVTWSADGSLSEGTIGAFWFQLVTQGTGCGDTCYNTVDWLVVTPDVDAGEFRVPMLSEEFLQYIEKRVLEVFPVGVQIYDTDTVSYGDILGNPPFDPWSLAESDSGVMGDAVPEPADGAPYRVRRTRTFLEL